MRKFSLFFILAVLFTIPTLAQQDSQLEEIRAVIEKFEQGFAEHNVDAMMSLISQNFSFKNKKGETRDYLQEKALLGKRMRDFFKKHIDYSFSELKLTKTKIESENADVWVEYKWEGFNLDSMKEIKGKGKKHFFLAKEGGEWKITNLIKGAGAGGKNKLKNRKNNGKVNPGQ
jgi:hypothetical protein